MRIQFDVVINLKVAGTSNSNIDLEPLIDI